MATKPVSNVRPIKLILTIIIKITVKIISMQIEEASISEKLPNVVFKMFIPSLLNNCVGFFHFEEGSVLVQSIQQIIK